MTAGDTYRPVWAPAYLDPSQVALLLREPACDECGHTRGLVRWLAYGTIRCGEHPITRLDERTPTEHARRPGGPHE